MNITLQSERILTNTQKTFILTNKLKVSNTILKANKMDYLVSKSKMNGYNDEESKDNVLKKLLDPKIKDVVLEHILETLIRDDSEIYESESDENNTIYDKIEALKTDERLNRILNKILEDSENSLYLTQKWLVKYKKYYTIEELDNIITLNLNEKHISKIENLPLINLQKLSLDFNEISKIENLNKLNNLQELRLYENKISKIENLETLINLTYLNLTNNKISKIENLNKLTNLQKLYLSSNNIEKIENLETLTNLKELYLSYNNIEKIENLETLTNLKELYLSYNKIKKIENLNKLTNLQKLELYNNVIIKIENLSSLTRLQALHIFPQNLNRDEFYYNNIKYVKKLKKRIPGLIMDGGTVGWWDDRKRYRLIN